MTMNIAERVNSVFTDCLFRSDEIENGKPKPSMTEVDGVIRCYGLHTARLESHREDVRALLELMPREFQAGGGGGMSFLNLCMDKDGTQWGDHSTMEKLVVLGLGLGMAKFCLPRDFWMTLPGGMPYVVFDTKAVKENA